MYFYDHISSLIKKKETKKEKINSEHLIYKE